MASMNLPRIQKASGLRLFWYTLWARAYPRIIGSWREKSWTFFDILFPTLTTISYIFVYKALDAPEQYIGFVVMGGAMTAFWLNVLWAMASQLYWDKDAGNLELYVLSPAPLGGILMGMAVGGLIWSSLRAVIILTVCSLLFGVQYEVGNLLQLLLVFFLTMAALYGMGMMFSSIYLVAGRDAHHLSNLLQEPIYLASGFYFPVRAIGTGIAYVASVIPLTLGMDAMRQIVWGESFDMWLLPVWSEIGILALLAVIFVSAAFYGLARLEVVGRREGRLIERRK